MSNKIFNLEIKEGSLIIPPEVTEYIYQCPQEVKIALMIQSPLNLSFTNKTQQDFQKKWNNWLEEVDELEILPSEYRFYLL